METIGDRIRKRRKELGLTQGELGKRSGLGTATISGLELGTQHSTTKLHRVADELRCRIEWLESGVLPMLAVEGVREAELFKYTAHNARLDVSIGREARELGAEWEKIEGEFERTFLRDFIYGLVSAQKRGAKTKGKELTTSAKGPKNRHVRHSSGHS